MKAPVVATLMLCLAASFQGAGAARGDEAAVKGSARAIWGERAQGKTYRIAEDVEMDGVHRKYVLETSEGAFTIISDALMAMRLNEYAVYEQLNEDTGLGHFVRSFGASALAPLRFGGQLITSPIETARQSAEGVGNFFDSLSTSGENKDSERGSFLGGVLGTDSARRDLAAQAQVDPYTDFPPLAKRLQELAAARGVGSLSMRGAMMAVPGGAALPSLTATTTRTVMFSASSVGAAQGLQEALRTKTAGQIMRDCREKLTALAPDAEVVDALLNNKNYTPADLLVIAVALAQVAAGDSVVFLRQSSGASDRTTAYLNRQQAEMYAGLRRSFPFDHFVARDGFVLMALRDHRHLLATPADQFLWTAKNRQDLTALDATLTAEKPALSEPLPAKTKIETQPPKKKVMVITGDYSKMARSELAKLNWEPARMTLTAGLVSNAKPAKKETGPAR
jgi:hypothetical protein